MRAIKSDKFEYINILFLTVLALVIAVLVWNYRNIQVDDAYITYRYARNLASGQGFTYNPPQPVLGTTTPLYALLLAGISLLGFDIPFASLIMGGVSWFSIALLFHRVGMQQDRSLSIYLPALLVVLIPGSVLILGMETALYTALIYIALYTSTLNRHKLAVWIAAASTLTRYDGVLVVGVILLHEWYVSRKFPLTNGLLFAVLLTPWMIFATVTFGSPIPNTFFAKTGDFAGNIFVEELPFNLLTLLGFFALGDVSGWLMGLGILVICLVAFFVLNNLFIRLIATWTGLYLVVYALLGIRCTFHWYYYPILPAFLLVLIGVIQAVRIKLINSAFISTPKLRWLIGQSVVVISLIPVVAMTLLGDLRLYQQAEALPALGQRNIVYRLAAEWLCQHTEEQTTVAVPEIGLIGWYCNRPIIDPYGLVNPEMIPYIQHDDRLGGVASSRPDLIIITNVPKESDSFVVPGVECFQDLYEVKYVIETERYPYLLVIFEKD